MEQSQIATTHQRLPGSLAVHNGAFHADEVTAAAMLILFGLVDPTQIIRTRDLNLIHQCLYVCDVGGIYDPTILRFDHHQHTYRGFLSSAGMVLAHLHETQIISQELFKYLNDSLIHGVDEHDIGTSPPMPGYTHYSHIIASYNPIHYEATEEEENEAFGQALDFALAFLRRTIRRYQDNLQSRQIVAEAMASGQDLLVFNQPLPWLENFFYHDGVNHPARFVLYPSKGQWRLRGIPPSLANRMSLRLRHPEPWLGKMDQELQIITGIAEAIFCHKSGFVSVWGSQKAAMQAYHMICKQDKNKAST
jgi:uncharacterized UPF0160 family protein